LNLAAAERDKLLYGAHAITRRLEDLPLRGDYGEAQSQPGPISPNEGLATLGKLGLSGSLALGSWIADVMAHSGSDALPASAQEREAWGVRGRTQIESIVRKMQMNEAMEALRQHDRYTQQVIIPKLGKWMP